MKNLTLNIKKRVSASTVILLTVVTLTAMLLQPSTIVHAKVGADVTLAGIDLGRQFFSPDLAPNNANLLWKFPLGVSANNDATSVMV